MSAAEIERVAAVLDGEWRRLYELRNPGSFAPHLPSSALAAAVVRDLAAARAESQDAGLRERIEWVMGLWGLYLADYPDLDHEHAVYRNLRTALAQPDALPAPTRADVDQQDDHGANGGRYGGDDA